MDVQEALALILDSKSSFFRPSWKSGQREAMTVSHWYSRGVSKDAPTFYSVLVTACFTPRPPFETETHIAQVGLELATKPKMTLSL